ncbi:hypothetical protein RA277_28740, partial [Pseudomonas syringae pv. tagetis]
GFTEAADDPNAADDAETVIITRNGNKFFAVADVAGYNWCATGADAIVMLYEPVLPPTSSRPSTLACTPVPRWTTSRIIDTSW